jgi:hypothetical protein
MELRPVFSPHRTHVGYSSFTDVRFVDEWRNRRPRIKPLCKYLLFLYKKLADDLCVCTLLDRSLWMLVKVRVRVTLRLAIYRQSARPDDRPPPRPTTGNFIFQLNTCDYSPYVTSSLTRGWVCRLQLLLSSPAQSFSGPSPAGLMTTFYCLRYETPPTWRTRSLYLYPPGTGWPGYTSVPGGISGPPCSSLDVILAVSFM